MSHWTEWNSIAGDILGLTPLPMAEHSMIFIRPWTCIRKSKFTWKATGKQVLIKAITKNHYFTEEMAHLCICTPKSTPLPTNTPHASVSDQCDFGGINWQSKEVTANNWTEAQPNARQISTALQGGADVSDFHLLCYTHIQESQKNQIKSFFLNK